MRLSFPYYLGPATWTLFHTLAEASGKDPRLVEPTKAMLRPSARPPARPSGRPPARPPARAPVRPRQLSLLQRGVQ
jgi:hypothetical protein